MCGLSRRNAAKVERTQDIPQFLLVLFSPSRYGPNVEKVTNFEGYPQYAHISNEKALDWVVSLSSVFEDSILPSLISYYSFPFIIVINYAGHLRSSYKISSTQRQASGHLKSP